MKKILVLSLLPFCFSLTAQVLYDFEDGTVNGWVFNQPGRWIAENISPLSGGYSLHHIYDSNIASADAAMFSIAGLCPSCSEVKWKFDIRYAADPSSSNRWAFILMSDSGPAGIAGGDIHSGFIVGVNLTGYDDTLRLWRVSEGKAETVVSTDINWQEDVGSSGMATITVTRQQDGRWIVEMAWNKLFQPDAGSETEGWEYGEWEGSDETLSTAGYSGILYVYTSTRDRLLWIDDIIVQGIFIPDTVPPAPVSVTALGQNILQVILDEEPDASFTHAGNITLESKVEITEVTRTTPAVYRLQLDSTICNRHTEVIHIGTLCDLAGNCNSDISFSFYPAFAVTGDILISEIMADPTPSHGLPEREYLEITNRTADSLYLGGMYLIAGRDTVSVNAEWIQASVKIILCSDAGKEEFLGFGSVMGLKSLPSLNDDGEIIALRDTLGMLIHAVSYTPAFVGNDPRSYGGWAAEMTDMDNPFNEPYIWSPSEDPSGGTPGRANSVDLTVPDFRCPQVVAIWLLSPDTLAVLFDETVMLTNGEPWLADGTETFPASSGDPSDRLVLVPLHNAILPGTLCQVTIPSLITDFAGNMPYTNQMTTGIPSHPKPGDILFNEILPDPGDGSVEYVELYNNSAMIFDLSELSLANGYTSVPVSFSKIHRQLLPGEYVCLTTDLMSVIDHYPCADIAGVFEADRLPALPDDRGTVVLYDLYLNIIDRVDYSDDMHLIFISGTEGVALEKVSPSLQSDIPGNWHSASEACDWGTPGAANSVTVNTDNGAKGLTLSSSRVSPDGDGFEDVISVNMFPGGEDNIISVTVYNDRGYPVRRLAVRFSAGPGTSFIWDGTSDNGSRLPAGLYLIMAESYNTAGSTKRWKEVCALLYR
jgi:hypothetical protein